MRFNEKSSTKTKNIAGGSAYSMKDKEELAFAVVTTFLDNKFYESAGNRMKRIDKLVKKVSAKDPLFIAKLAIITRKEFHFRSSFHWLIATLSKHHNGDSLVRKAIVEGVERPDDLMEIVSATGGKPIPNQVKKGVREALKKFNDYQLAKYRGEGKKLSLVDLFNLVHPKPGEKNKETFKKLMEGKLKTTGKTWESRLSSGTEEKAEVWKDMVLEGKIGYMALLRNLRNIEETQDDELITKAAQMICDRERVKKSKQLPFRFDTAYKNVTNQVLLHSIAEALEYSLDNVPKYDGKTLIAVDTSGSMDGQPLDIASLFAAVLFKSNDSEVVLYNTSIKPLKALRRDSALTIANAIRQQAHGGGTETSLVFKYAKETGVKYNRIIILSDNESWGESWHGESVNTEYNRYKKTNDCYVYAIDIQGYGTTDVKGGRVFHFATWSDKLFDLMDMVEKENGLVAYIDNYKTNFS